MKSDGSVEKMRGTVFVLEWNGATKPCRNKLEEISSSYFIASRAEVDCGDIG